MKRIRLRGWLVLAVIGGLLALGCSGGSDRPATYKVTGTVTWNNSPVVEANVSFAPAGEGGKAAVGKTDTSGQYTLSTFGGGDGAVPGQYNVTITKYESRPEAAAGAGEDEAAAYDAAMKAAEGKEELELPPAKNLLPPKYADAKTSGFTKTVEANDNNLFDFTLEGSAN